MAVPPYLPFYKRSLIYDDNGAGPGSISAAPRWWIIRIFKVLPARENSSGTSLWKQSPIMLFSSTLYLLDSIPPTVFLSSLTLIFLILLPEAPILSE